MTHELLAQRIQLVSSRPHLACKETLCTQSTIKLIIILTESIENFVEGLNLVVGNNFGSYLEYEMVRVIQGNVYIIKRLLNCFNLI